MLTHLQQPPSAPQRVVVLGTRGFVASNLLNHLDRAQVPVVGVSSADVDLGATGAATALSERLHPTDALVFVSALTPDKGKDAATMMRNLAMGVAVGGAIAARSPRHVVYISSDAVYADDVNPVRESSCASPNGFHGLMHLTRERMLIETARTARVPLAILRPSLLYGADDTHNGYGPNRFMRTAVKDGRVALFGDGEEQRDHVYIDDVSRLIALVLSHRSEGVLNVATGISHSFRAVADAVATLAGGPVSIEASPRANPITHRHFDVTDAVAAFPSFSYTPLTDGLQRAMQTTAGSARA
jgi:nucleoside-diphosphate-sugar epimerase